MGFTKSKVDCNHYDKLEEGNPLILLLYVDDLFVIGEDRLIYHAKRNLATEFEVKDLGMMHYFLGMEVWQNEYGMFLGQGKYTVAILKRFRMMEWKAMSTPMASSLNLLSDTPSKLVDAKMYHMMIG